MSSNTPISPAGVSIGDLRELVKTDLRASNELQQRIDQLHEDANEGRSPSINQALMGIEHKRIGKDLVLHIEQIEAQGDLAKDDREMLQQLTARLAIHDLQSARLAQYRDLQLAGGRQRPREWLETEKHPSEAQPSSSRKRRSTNTEPILEPWAGLNTSPSSTVTPQPMPAGTTTEDVFPKRSTFAGEQAEYDEDGDSDSDDQAEYYDEEPNVNKSTWPLLYRIIGIDPETPEYLFGAELDRYDACPSMTLAIANVGSHSVQGASHGAPS